MTAHSDGRAEGPRLYGNWRPERGWGIGSMSTSATVAVFLAVLAPVLAISTVPRAALPLAGIGAVVIGAVVVRVGGVTAAEAVTRRFRFSRARAGGWTELSAGVLTDHPRAHDLPGVLAPLVPLDVDDGRGGRHALLWDRNSGTLTAVLRCSPIGLDLADPAQTDVWVASWGVFLADLGYQPLVQHVAVTVDTAPSGGTTMRDYVAAALDPRAPALSRTVLNELVAITPTTAAEVDARLTVAFDPNRANPRPMDLFAAVVDVGRWLPGIETGLGACGVAVLGRATTSWLTGRIRVAFDPAARSEVTRLDDRAALLAWSEAGPVAALESWDTYRHDSGISVSWALREAPRQAVAPRVLASLLTPGPYPRRVTWLYEPYPADQAAAKVEAEVTSGQIRRAWAARTRRDETQRERDDRDRALQSAREEAEGAGVGRFTVYLTTTVTDPDDLPAAVADLEQRAGQAKLRLRRLRGAQAAGFAAALGVGINPAEAVRNRTRR
ncbi:SCO6880 family protein [Pseudonocardia oceani]|uniref:SCO6880 family protein n=1 Tax=Pseudonocardia oceani TaxID=2792013 RepID=UPI001C4A249C|nr:SCO6880 family protein [Pseudonocardia oceani]